MATAGVPLWSTTASSNSTADPAVNWAEGMAASAVNDSGRALMASVAKWRDDLYGITTGGTSTAYTVTTGSTFLTAAAMSGVIFTIIPHTTSGASPTLAVDSLTARALNVSTGVAVPTGALVSGTPYLVKYVHASTEFIVLGGVGVLGNTTITGTLSVSSTLTASSGMTLSAGQYTSPVGSVGAPTYTFVGDLDCGMYRIGANNIGLAVNGAKVLDIATTGLSVTGSVTVSSGFTVSAGSVSLPAGSIANAALAAPGAMVYLGTLTASNSATLDFTTISATYDDYVFEFDNLLPATDDVELWVRAGTGAGPTYQTTSYITAGIAAKSGGATSAMSRNTAIGIGSDSATESVGNDATYGISGRVTAYGVNSANLKFFTFLAGYLQSSGTTNTASCTGTSLWTGGTAALTGIRFMFEAGNITSGVIRVYGLVHA